MPSVNPYLNFNGDCEAAFELYKSVFGGEYGMFSRFGDMPNESAMNEREQQKILHVSLPIGETILMGSDAPEAYGKMNIGNNFSISINTESEEDANRIFAGLSAGGTVTMPLGKTFWGAYFGMLKDKYEICWMVNYDYPKEGEIFI